MELESLTCSHCGAPLEVPKSANFVTCRHCGQQLAVKRSASAAWTEQLEQLEEQTQRISEQLDEITRQNELERIDREWEQERQQYMIQGKSGRRHIPAAASSVVGGVVMSVFGIIWMSFAAMASPPFALFGLLFIGFAIFLAINGFQKAGQYQQAERRYRERRAEMLRSDALPSGDTFSGLKL